MVTYLLKKSYQHKTYKEINFKDLWGDNGVFTTMWIFGNPTKILFFKKHIKNLIKSLKIYKLNTLNLEKNIDCLNYVAKHNSLRPKLVIGFAAETNNLVENSKNKLIEKNCDWIIANDVSNKSIGFNSDFNEVTIFYKNKKINYEKLYMKKKSEISDEIIDRVISQLN